MKAVEEEKKKAVFGPKTDGVDHINIYSRAKTEAGRLLSNFAPTPFTLYGVRFASVEGFYFSLLFDDEETRALIAQTSGREAKAWGKKCGKEPGDPVRTWDDRTIPFKGDEFYEEVEAAITAKVEQNAPVRQALLSTGELPLDHYYVMFGKPIRPRGETGRLVACFTDLRKRLREEGQALE